MASRKTRQTTQTVKRTGKKPRATPERDDYSPAGLAARIEAESTAARLALSRLLATALPSTNLERNAGQALYMPDELARIAAALRSIEAAAAFVRCSGVAS